MQADSFDCHELTQGSIVTPQDRIGTIAVKAEQTVLLVKPRPAPSDCLPNRAFALIQRIAGSRGSEMDRLPTSVMSAVGRNFVTAFGKHCGPLWVDCRRSCGSLQQSFDRRTAG
jgi:hypothetical protein